MPNASTTLLWSTLLANATACAPPRPDGKAERAELYMDNDGDGWGTGEPQELAPDTPGYADQGGDCDDDDPTINPGAVEIVGDNVDEDCDQTELCYADDDQDGAHGPIVQTDRVICRFSHLLDNTSSLDCDDEDPSRYPGAQEVCYDGVVNDCDSDEAAAAAICTGDLTGEVELDAAGYPLGMEGRRSDWTASGVVGGALAGGGDVNGDGLADLVMGDPGDSTGDTSSGAAYVVQGPVTATVDLGEADGILLGPEHDGRAGGAVALGGDVDGDGLDDLLIGEPGSQWGGWGAATLVLGPASGRQDLVLADGILFGPESGAVGSAVAIARDLDGDGLADLLVAGPRTIVSDSWVGKVWAVPGPALGGQDLDETTAEGSVVGMALDEQLGTAMSAGGDVDGDGLSDLLVGSPGAGCGSAASGAVELFHAPLLGALTSEDADAELCGPEVGDGTGTALDMTGDVDGDGLADVLVGSSDASSPEAGGGAAWLVLSPPPALMTLSRADAIVYGERKYGALGTGVTDGADFDGDSHADLLIGAPESDGAVEYAGTALLFYGPILGTYAVADADLSLGGGTKNSLVGYAVVGAGDTNGAGHDDLLIGAPNAPSAQAFLVTGDRAF